MCDSSLNHAHGTPMPRARAPPAPHVSHNFFILAARPV
jgi:hypothetical protein